MNIDTPDTERGRFVDKDGVLIPEKKSRSERKQRPRTLYYSACNGWRLDWAFDGEPDARDWRTLEKVIRLM